MCETVNFLKLPQTNSQYKRRCRLSDTLFVMVLTAGSVGRDQHEEAPAAGSSRGHTHHSGHTDTDPARLAVKGQRHTHSWLC